MQNYFFAPKRRPAVIGVVVVILLALIIVGVLQAPFWQSKAATSNIDPHLQFCRTFYKVPDDGTSNGSIVKYNNCHTLDDQFKNYVQSLHFTYGTAPQTSATPTPQVDATSTSQVSATPTPQTSITPTPQVTATPTPQVSTTPTPQVTTTPTNNGAKNWPMINLVALTNPTDQSLNIKDIPNIDIKETEDALTAYYQSQISTDPRERPIDQAAINAWLSDPFLRLALVTYSIDPTTGNATYEGGDNTDATITTLANFLRRNTTELKTIQTDLSKSLKSSTYTNDGANCTFAAADLAQAYRNCLGTDTLVDILYAQNILHGDDAATAYKNAVSVVTQEFTGPIKQYLQNNNQGDSGTAAQQAYNTITGITDEKLLDTYIDHVLTNVVQNISLDDSAPTPPASTPTPTLTPTATPSMPTPTPTATPSMPTPTPTATARTPYPPTPTSTANNGSQDMPLSMFQSLPTDTHTWYGADNNDPPGYDSYAHANGTGTYANPITFAIAEHSTTFKQGEIIYIPELEKYFYAEDTCAECQNELDQGKQDHIDLWTDHLPSDCEVNIKVPPTMYSSDSNPEPIHYLAVSADDTADQNYTVNTAPFSCN